MTWKTEHCPVPKGHLRGIPSIIPILLLFLLGCRSTPPAPPPAPAVAMADRAEDQAAKLSAQQNWSAAVPAWQLARDRFSLLNDRPGEAIALHNLAQAERELERTEEALQHLQQAAALNAKLGRTNEWWRNQIALLQLEGQSNQSEPLRARFNELSTLASRLQNHSIQGLFFNELGLWQKSQGDFSQAEKAFSQAEHEFQAARDPYGVAAISANRAELFEAQKNYPAALASWKQALAGFQSLHDPPGITRALTGQGRALLAANQDLATAEELLRRAARNYLTLQKPKQAQTVLELLALCLTAEGKKEEADSVRREFKQ